MTAPTVDLGTVFTGSRSGRIVQAQGTTRALRPDEVVIDITHSGLCGTDLHFRKANMVLGHEGVGIVSQVGSDVMVHKVGDRVGWGYNHNACGYCPECWNGNDILCPDRKMYGSADRDFGSFGDRAVLNALFVHKIPDAISLRDAGPLQCGGATVYGAIVNAKVQPRDRVGVLGLGGLGHLAVQYLSKMGCDVVVFSGTDDKKQQATELGASEFVATKGNEKLRGIRPLNHLLVSTSQQPDWKRYFSILAPGGTVVPLTVSSGDMAHPYAPILTKQLTITGSLVARRQVHREMLEFSARHNIKPMIEVLPMTEDGLNTAFGRLERGDVRYRFVLESPRAHTHYRASI